MTTDEVFTKLVNQRNAGLITENEFWQEVRESALMSKVGINEGMAC
jgi:hypothetical protein